MAAPLIATAPPQEFECVICLEDHLEKKDILTLTCGHYFCKICLPGCSETCPLCRAPFNLQPIVIKNLEYSLVEKYGTERYVAMKGRISSTRSTALSTLITNFTMETGKCKVCKVVKDYMPMTDCCYQCVCDDCMILAAKLIYLETDGKRQMCIACKKTKKDKKRCWSDMCHDMQKMVINQTRKDVERTCGTTRA